MKRHQTEVNVMHSKQATITEVAVQEPTIKQCYNCIQRQSCVAYMPCGLGGICQECAIQPFEQNKQCPICRSRIKALLQIQQIDDQKVERLHKRITDQKIQIMKVIDGFRGSGGFAIQLSSLMHDLDPLKIGKFKGEFADLPKDYRSLIK